MIYLIILLESILIIFLIDIEYDVSDSYKITLITNSQEYSNSTYNALDIVGNNILIFNKTPNEDKIFIWLESPLNHQMLAYSPNIEVMEDFFSDRVEDNGTFKNNFLKHMRSTHDEYIGTLLTKEEFEKKISDPNSFLAFND